MSATVLTTTAIIVEVVTDDLTDADLDDLATEVTDRLDSAMEAVVDCINEYVAGRIGQDNVRVALK